MPRKKVKKKRKKKQVKRSSRTATAAPAKISSKELDAWAGQQLRQRGCHACRDVGVRETIRALLEAMIRMQAYRTTIHEIKRMVEKYNPKTCIGRRTLERHLRVCERDLYAKARGRL